MIDLFHSYDEKSIQISRTEVFETQVQILQFPEVFGKIIRRKVNTVYMFSDFAAILFGMFRTHGKKLKLLLVICCVISLSLRRKFIYSEKSSPQERLKNTIEEVRYSYTQNAKKIIVTTSIKKFVDIQDKRDSSIRTQFAFVTALSKNHFYEFSAHLQSIIDFTRNEEIEAVFFIYSLDSDSNFVNKLEKYLMEYLGLNYWLFT